ncbi:hypothetical protein TwortDSMZ_106 [Staphylococcus phage Twort]|uniref:Uncharacterized protein n=3 Tax=Twortvirus twort TaxID=55510 RepID=A0A6H0X5B1_BPTWO|nr:intron encoded nuclease [Staphylococcus phage Twort]AAX92314.1 ORF018 [Staphylococcus phage Twort]QIW89105.1 hypothetical protein TwortDSMZ_106 [Staphylococcus phage Twort]
MDKKILKEASRLGIKIIKEDKITRNKTHVGVILRGKFKGCECHVSYEYLKNKNNNTEFVITILTDRGKKQYFNKVAEERGYKILEYPKELLTVNRCKLLSPKGNTWDVQWNSFENNRNSNCPKDKLKSIGERIVATILRENNIDFTSEKGIYTGLKVRQRLDFYFIIGGQKYAIEYMGRQHTEEVKGGWGVSLDRIIFLDKLKEEYCRSNGIKLLQVWYPMEDKESIFTEIKEFLDIPLKYTPEVDYISRLNDNEEEILEYYKNHSAEETSNKYGITINQVKGILNRTKFTKRFKSVEGINIKSGEKLQFNTLKEAQEYFKDSKGVDTIRACVIGKRKTACGYIWRYKDEDFSELSTKITDKRIKVFKAIKGSEVITLPLQMLSIKTGLAIQTITKLARNKGKTSKGYEIIEVTGEEKGEILDSISFVDYVQSLNKK